MENNVTKKYLLRVAINLYYIQFENAPNYGGEIDELEESGFTKDEMLTSFCTSFLDYCYKKIKYIKMYNLNEKVLNDRLYFFKLCCDKEIELIDKEKTPLVFYWDDYFNYKKYDFQVVIDNAINRKEKYLILKKQLSVNEVIKMIDIILCECNIFFKDLKKIILFGSLAKGKNCETSDIDLLFVFEKNNPMIRQLVYMFQKEFEKMTSQFPDVSIIIDGNTNRFIDWILSYGKEVYKK